MDDSTRSILQGLMDLSVSHGKNVAKLQAMVGLHNFIIIDLLQKTDVMSNLLPEVRESFDRATIALTELSEYGGSPEDFSALLAILEERLS